VLPGAPLPLEARWPQPEERALLPAVRRRLEASPRHELAAVRPQPLRAVLRGARQRENLRLPPEASQPQGRLVVWRLLPASAAEPQWALPDAAAGQFCGEPVLLRWEPIGAAQLREPVLPRQGQPALQQQAPRESGLRQQGQL